jgi:hypothetical protein
MPTQTSAQKPAGASTQTFRGAVDMPEANGATSFLEVPAETVEALGAGKRPPVSVTLNGYTYRSTVAVYSGRYYLPVRKEVREGARITPGEPLDVSIALDSAPRTVEVPDDLSASLDADPQLRAAFDALSYSHKKEYVEWITGAKREETRRQRIEKTGTMLRAGVKTPKS